jgi:catechol 2,3-dioxygenase-like lactoylglutathione lyase family enzyme
MLKVKAINHINVSVREGQMAAGREFYKNVLGLTEVDLPNQMTNDRSAWFRIGSTEVHLSIDAEFDPATTKVHIAYEVENIEDAIKHIEAQNIEVRKLKLLDQYIRYDFRDPFNNRIELMQLR